MSVVAPETEPIEPYLTLRMNPAVKLTDDQFFELCQINRDLRLERTSKGDIIIMAPAGGETSTRNSSITGQLYYWTKRDGTGIAFDSSAGFKLPNGAERSPDAAWVSHLRLAKLTPAQKKKFIPLCPDFVVELMSPTDSLTATKAKMAEYLVNGARLGWLIHADARKIYVYRPGTPVEELKDVTEISADPELSGFVLDLTDIWEPNI